MSEANARNIKNTGRRRESRTHSPALVSGLYLERVVRQLPPVLPHGRVKPPTCTAALQVQEREDANAEGYRDVEKPAASRTMALFFLRPISGEPRNALLQRCPELEIAGGRRTKKQRMLLGSATMESGGGFQRR